MTAPVSTSDRFSAPRPAVVPAARVDRDRVREFGVGYGASSGYATARRHTSPWGAPRFRCT